MPWSRILSFTDPLPYQAAIRAADVELYPTSRGEFRAELTQINLNQLWMQRFDEKLPQVYASKIKPGRKVIGFLTSANQPPFQHSARSTWEWARSAIFSCGECIWCAAHFLRADPATATVTRLATDHGFWELGRFSVAYRALFGESPSESLRRPADDRPIFFNRPSSLASSAFR